jgi:hypothetical protein
VFVIATGVHRDTIMNKPVVESGSAPVLLTSGIETLSHIASNIHSVPLSQLDFLAASSLPDAAPLPLTRPMRCFLLARLAQEERSLPRLQHVLRGLQQEASIYSHHT